MNRTKIKWKRSDIPFFTKNLNYKQISEYTGMTEEQARTFASFLKKSGYDVKIDTTTIKEKFLKMKTACSLESIKETSQKLGLNVNTVYDYRKKNNLSKPKKKFNENEIRTINLLIGNRNVSNCELAIFFETTEISIRAVKYRIKKGKYNHILKKEQYENEKYEKNNLFRCL